MAQLLLTLVVSIILITSLLPTASTSTFAFLSRHNNVTDRHALISLKSMISSEPSGLLASWNSSIHFCMWAGVTCGGRRHPQRVIALNLSSLQLMGSISPAIANLSFLEMVDLSDNRFQGSIPEEIGQLLRLQHLNLGMNSIEGGIPVTLSHCSKLKGISLENNLLQGEIPPSLCNCSDLRIINLANNSLTGRIPISFTNLSSLSILSIYQNRLHGDIPPTIGNMYSLVSLDLYANQLSGSIPPSLGKLSKLKILYLSSNNLTGIIPTSVWNLSLLVILGLSSNSLIGSLPPNTGQTLPLLEEIYVAVNNLHGPIPISLPNASHLIYVELGDNRFSGTIPAEFGSLKNLQGLLLGPNQLEAREPDGLNFISSLVNCTKLEVLDLGDNKLRGMLPNSIANISTLQFLSLTNNYVNGNIPSDIGNLARLTDLELGDNLLSGSIPNSIGRLYNLIDLSVVRNKLSGKIPSTIGNLSQLNELYLDFNELSGNIPAKLTRCQHLNLLNLKANKLTGAIPKEIFRISTLGRSLTLSHNSLTGALPSEVGMLRNLAAIDLSFNKFSGQLPSTLGDCILLQELYLGENFFHGTIPLSLASLRGIRELDVSKNKLSGQIPDFLQNLKGLRYLNLSFNNFEGEVPRHGVFENTSAFSVVGNNNLCGGNPALRLPACLNRSTNKNHISHTLLVFLISIASIISIIFFLFIACCWSHKSRRTPLQSSLIKEQHAKVSYAELVKATNGFSSDNLIGVGSFSNVYKGMLDADDGGLQVVAVKVLNLQLQGASKSFIAECEALRNIRHRNLLRIITVCSSTDFRGNNFKAVVSEFMACGSLDDWLHPKENHQCEQKNLSLIQRLNIAIDVATALDYLHCQCETPIAHCDLKPSNILLDGDMIAHVGDFGISKILEEAINKSSLESGSSIGLKGTVGYVALEYGMMNRVSVQGDVYSYGILLLEMFTAKRPTDEMFKDDFDLRKFVKPIFLTRITDVMDVRLLLKEGEWGSDDVHRTMECVASVFKVGIKCSSELPTDRMKMWEVVVELHKIRDAFIRYAN